MFTNLIHWCSALLSFFFKCSSKLYTSSTFPKLFTATKFIKYFDQFQKSCYQSISTVFTKYSSVIYLLLYPKTQMLTRTVNIYLLFSCYANHLWNFLKISLLVFSKQTILFTSIQSPAVSFRLIIMTESSCTKHRKLIRDLLLLISKKNCARLKHISWNLIE